MAAALSAAAPSRADRVAAYRQARATMAETAWQVATTTVDELLTVANGICELGGYTGLVVARADGARSPVAFPALLDASGHRRDVSVAAGLPVLEMGCSADEADAIGVALLGDADEVEVVPDPGGTVIVTPC